LNKGFTFIDVGCGDGFFTIPSAKRVGPEGKIYGIDHNQVAINRLREKAAKEGLKQVVLTVGKAEELIVCSGCADVVFFGIVLHDFADPMKVLQNAKQMLKPSGKLVNLDWKKELMFLGPPYRIRFSKEQALHLIRDAGFTIEQESDEGAYHYLIIAGV
jgi:ubiquinone/menaquinone biosynthesis C-methylase UbiE